MAMGLLLFVSGNSYGEDKDQINAESITPEEFESFLNKVKIIHSNGPKVYSFPDIQDDWESFNPWMIIVMHDNVKFFLNPDLSAPKVLEFSRNTGAWLPKSTRWTVSLKLPNTQKTTELWSRTDLVSDKELEVIRRYSEYRNAQEQAGQQATDEKVK